MPRGGPRPGSGRKRKEDEARIRDYTSLYVDGAIETVAKIMNDKYAKDADRLSAAKIIISYHFGQPSNKVDITSGGKEIAQPVFTVQLPEDLKDE